MGQYLKGYWLKKFPQNINMTDCIEKADENRRYIWVLNYAIDISNLRGLTTSSNIQL